MQNQYPDIAADPLVKVFRGATAAERKAIVSGIRALRLLFERQQLK